MGRRRAARENLISRVEKLFSIRKNSYQFFVVEKIVSAFCCEIFLYFFDSLRLRRTSQFFSKLPVGGNPNDLASRIK